MSFQLTVDDKSTLEVYLRERRLIASTDHVLSTERPGDGNMNCTVRAVCKFGSLIVKQSRPYVEKYPSIAAPLERTLIEGQFYELVAPHDCLRAHMPNLLLVDPDNFIIVLEDLGESADFTNLYGCNVQLHADELTQLLDFVGQLHAICTAKQSPPRIANRAMRNLNAQHIFRLPFDPQNGFDLDSITPGLAQVALPLQHHEPLKARVAQLEQMYLADGPVLLHGDYYPGSWLAAESGVKIIDPEFCFFGPAEFDLGVMLAHLMMAQQPIAFAEQLLATSTTASSQQTIHRFAGIEIIRRLIGLAQLPLALDLAEKQELLDAAQQLVLEPTSEPSGLYWP